MKPKSSHCMNSRWILAIAAAFCVSAASAQTLPYDRVADRNVWLYGGNPAGLRASMDSTISYAELHGGAEAGDFRHSYEASSLWTAGAEARSIKHLERFSMVGGFSFDQTVGQDMCGSMFIRPGYYPIDALEFTPGQKTLQTYAFDGGVSIDIAPQWRIGAGLDFASSNYSKRKDLRHTNYRLDLEVSPGVTFTTSDGNMAFGLNYIYAKDSEYTDPEQIGTAESTYYAFLDKGLMYGKYEAWSGSGVHLDESGVQGLPLREHFHGVGVQVGMGGTYFGEVEYRHGSGLAGEKQTIWYRFPTDRLTVRLAENLRLLSGREMKLREYVTDTRLHNYETVLEKVTEGGVTTSREYGSNLILGRKTLESGVDMEIQGRKADWRVYFISRTVESQASQMYPYVTNQTTVEDCIGFNPTFRPSPSFECGCDLSFAFGTLEEDSFLISEESGVSTRPYRLEEYYDLEAEYLTSPRLGASAFARYTLRRGIYIQARASLTHAWQLDCIPGPSRYCGNLALGWTF